MLDILTINQDIFMFESSKEQVKTTGSLPTETKTNDDKALDLFVSRLAEILLTQVEAEEVKKLSDLEMD